MSKLKIAEQVLFFLTVFFLPTQLGKHFWPDFSFVYSLPIDYLSPTLYFWDILVIFLCIIFIIRKEHINRKAIILFYFFIFIESLSLLISQNIGVGLVRLEQYLISGLFGVYIASCDLSRVKNILFWGLGLSIIMESSLAILHFIFIRFSSIFTFDSLTILRREELAENSWKMFTSSPIMGIGLNNFIPSSAQGLISGPSRFLQPVHNIFLLTLSETGLVGLLGLLITFGYPVWKLIKLRITNNEQRTLLIIWGVIIFLGMFDHYFLTLPQGNRLLFLVWGLSFSAKIV